jgi:glutathione peroxidase
MGNKHLNARSALLPGPVQRSVLGVSVLPLAAAFPMFEKSHVVGSGTNALYRALVLRTGDMPQWNFHKYLISRDGQEVLSFGSSVEPDDARLTAQIERMLKAGVRP